MFVVAPVSSNALVVTSSTSTLAMETGPTIEYKGFRFSTGDSRAPFFCHSLGQVPEIVATVTPFAPTLTLVWGSSLGEAGALPSTSDPLWRTALEQSGWTSCWSSSPWGPAASGQGPSEHFLSTASEGHNLPSLFSTQVADYLLSFLRHHCGMAAQSF